MRRTPQRLEGVISEEREYQELVEFWKPSKERVLRKGK